MDRIISKGAPEAIVPRCKSAALDGTLVPMDPRHVEDFRKEHELLSADGFRVLAIATKDLSPRATGAGDTTPYGKADECDLVLQGYVAFLDPPKDSAAKAIQALQRHGVAVKVVTGDNDLVARKICKEVGLATEFALLGDEVERMSDEQLADTAEKTTLFARVSPAHKQRIIQALQSRNHTVGFMGDGINDAPALHAADVGISVDTAVDIAKEVGRHDPSREVASRTGRWRDRGPQGLLQHRQVRAHGRLEQFRQHVQRARSQCLRAVPADAAGADPRQQPALRYRPDHDPYRRCGPRADPRAAPWDIAELTRFVLFIGPCSSIFDYTTYFMMLYVFNCWDISTPQAAAHSASLFQTGWFVESLLTQTLIIHVIRTNKIPFLQSRSSWPLLAMSVVIMAIGIAIPFSPVGSALGFTKLPPLYWPLLGVTLLCYVLLTQGVKMWLLRRKWI